jgi:hypothetical protein
MNGFVAGKARKENIRSIEHNTKYNQDIVDTNENMFIVCHHNPHL